MALEPRPASSSLFVASSDLLWRVERFDVAVDTGAGASSGSVSGALTHPDGVRGLAAISYGAVLATVDDALLRLDYSALPSSAVPLLSGLAEPWGVVVDPLATNHAYVALRAEDRVVDVSLETRELRDVLAVVLDGPGPAFPEPAGPCTRRTVADASCSSRRNRAVMRCSVP